jgi:hypothetical protein
MARPAAARLAPAVGSAAVAAAARVAVAAAGSVGSVEAGSVGSVEAASAAGEEEGVGGKGSPAEEAAAAAGLISIWSLVGHRTIA